MPIEIRDLCKAFGSHTVLSGVSMTIEAGSVTALSAPSGRGKTTLLRILAGLESPDSGSVSGLPAGGAAYFFQEPRLFDSLTALENVTLVSRGKKSEARDAAMDYLLSLGLTEADARLFPPALSGGMKQRVCAARLLLFVRERNTPLVLLDEPFKGLDGAIRQRTVSLFKKELAARTVLFVTHDPAEIAELAERVIEF